MNKYFAYYRNAYGNEHLLETFDNLNDVLALVKKANDEDSGLYDLVVIWGRKLEFEPCEVVKSWRVKE